MRTSTPSTTVRLGRNEVVKLERLPRSCPVCGSAEHPKFVEGRHGGSNRYPILSVVVSCTNPECLAVFVGYYRPTDKHESRYTPISDPDALEIPEMPQDVQALSPSFVAIHAEALLAESLQLPNVAGVGLRKALEFLVKDFAMHVAQSPEDKTAVRAMPLAKVITQHIADPHARAVASRAAWLGNDETHYVREWPDKDRSDLKVLIELTVTWVGSYLAGERYLKDMPS